MEYLIGAGGGIVAGIIVGVVVLNLIHKAKGDAVSAKADKVKDDAERIKRDAEKEAEHTRREAKMAAKGDVLKLKEDWEKEEQKRKKVLREDEKHLDNKLEEVKKRDASLKDRNKNLDQKFTEANQMKERIRDKEGELQKIIQQQIEELHRVAEMPVEDAKRILLEKLEGEIRSESGVLMRNVLDETKEKAEKEARKIITNAIQRYASDCTYERTTATIPITSDEMKGRIIGREGRNIRALEAATGVSILIDDTPEAIVISCFNPVRKEIARVLIERLVADGRIHPTRIEDLMKKITKEVESEIFEAGEEAVLEIGVHSVPPQIIKILGRLKFRYSYSQNVLKHSLETAFFMGMIAGELGLDVQKAKRIGLFHDLGKALDHEQEGTHAILGGTLLRKYNEDEEIINAVEAHHGEREQNSVYAVLTQACDALSASRPGARNATTELYLKRLEDLEDIALGFSGVESCFALQAGREIRVVVNPENVDEGTAQVLARDICTKIEKDMTYPGQIKVAIIRETRSVEYAK